MRAIAKALMLATVSSIAPGCGISPVQEYSFISAGDDKLLVNGDQAGFAYYGPDMDIRVEFLDSDLDGTADTLRYHGLVSDDGCRTMLEDYDSDGRFDMRWERCEGKAPPRIELHTGDKWIPVSKEETGMAVYLDGSRHNVILDRSGRLVLEGH